ncbi:MAG: mechanosensitive ion channel family protein, partial [Solobacterium sp.]|nr:mechanosensitive ion channel family protein [Solobacterium sp.]
DYVEAVLKKELPLLKDKNPKILEEPSCLGVADLGESGVNIAVIARCTENDVRSVNRFLNKEVLQIFYRNGINVPFPNVTVSELNTRGRKTMADFTDSSEETEQY